MTAKFFDGVLKSIDLGGDANFGRRLTMLRAIGHRSLGEEGVRLLVGKGPRVESGDFTKGADLNETQSKLIIDYIRAQQFTPLQYVGSDPTEAADDRGALQQFKTGEGEPVGFSE